MKTEQLVEMLAAGNEPVPSHAVARRGGVALGMGGAGAMGVMLLGFGLNPDLAGAARLPTFWLKLAFLFSLVPPAVLAFGRLARPEGRVGGGLVGLVVPVLAFGAHGAWSLAQARASDWSMPLLGDAWTSCSLSIAVLSMPLLLGLLWAMKGLAPTRLRAAGAAAGGLAGASAALVHALHCPEMAAPLLGLSDLAGITLPTAAGAILGLRVLRW